VTEDSGFVLTSSGTAATFTRYAQAKRVPEGISPGDRPDYERHNYTPERKSESGQRTDARPTGKMSLFAYRSSPTGRSMPSIVAAHGTPPRHAVYFLPAA